MCCFHLSQYTVNDVTLLFFTKYNLRYIENIVAIMSVDYGLQNESSGAQSASLNLNRLSLLISVVIS